MNRGSLTLLIAAAAGLAGPGAGCKAREAGLFVTVVGDVPDIAALHVTITAESAGRVEEADVVPPEASGTIALPATFTVVLEATRRRAREGALTGPFTVCVTAAGSTGGELASACGTENVEEDEVAEYTIDLGGGPGTDAGIDGGTCGDGVRQPGEPCDGADLGGADCASLGYSGGPLACDGGCAFDVSGCGGPPTVPVLRRPIIGSFVGSVHVPGSLRPAFGWEASTVEVVAAISYELEFGTDPSFGVASTDTVSVAGLSHVPASDLAVGLMAPVGARYHWRVRACAGSACSDFSQPWYVNVGREERDLNGDGYADVVTGGSSVNTPAGTDAGRVYVFFGGSGGSLEGAADMTLSGQEPFGGFGSAAAFADVNADGFADLLVGERWSDVPASNAGRVHVYLGGTAPASVPVAVLAGEGTEDELGASIASAGDVNGDGYADVVAGAGGNDAGGMNAGAAYVFLGGAGASFDPAPDAVLVGAAGDAHGFSVAGAGDFNGDGFADVVAGAYLGDGGEPGSGYAAIYFGGSTLETTPDVILDGATAGGDFGLPVSGGGDLDGDAFSDVVVAAPSSGIGGEVYLYRGGPPAELDASADGLISGSMAEPFSSSGAALAGDLNGDGFDDVAVGAQFADAGPLAVAGRVFVYNGGPGPALDVVADAVLSGQAANEHMGSAVAGAGDVNGDGFDDAIAGAFFSDGGGPNAGTFSARGRAYVFFGGAGGADATPDGIVTGEATGDQLGRLVAAPPPVGDEPVRALAVIGRRRRRRLPRDADATNLAWSGGPR